jgi:CysZ protein
MAFIFQILRRAAADLLLPRVLLVMFLPMLGALAIWGGLAWWFGGVWLTGLDVFVAESLMPAWLSVSTRDWLMGFAGFVLLTLLLVPMIYITALLITSLVFMLMLVGIVAQRHYPVLQRQQGGSFVGSLGNGLYALSVYLVLWLITLPFWLLGPFGVAISVLLNAWLNQRMFLYDALSEHATAAELQQLRRDGGWPLYLLAALLGLLHYLLLLNFFAPVYMGLAFTHYSLAKLAQTRASGVT